MTQKARRCIDLNLNGSRHLGLLASLISLLLISACGREEPAEQAQPSATPPQVQAEPVMLEDTITLGAEAITESSYRRHIEILASDEFGGRAPASPGGKLTVDYLTTAFTELGLEPANGDSYTQNVPLAWVEAINKPDLVFTDNQGEELTLAYVQDQVIGTRQQVKTTSIYESEVVFVGYGINAPERGWNDYEGVDVRNKTVIMLVNDPGYATQDPELFNGNAMTYYGRWDYKFNEAASQGASGAIIIHDTKPASYPWSTVSNSWTGPDFNMVLEDKGAGLALVEGWITRESAEIVLNKAGYDLTALMLEAQQRGFQAVKLGLRASASLTNNTETVYSQNVAAMIRGSEAPDEIFIYMAHWDHIGTDPTMEGDNIFNGALDNASGTAALLELAKAYSTLPVAPRRSVLFLAVTAEEQGLLGSQYYAANPLFPLASTVGGINMDGMNNFGPTRDVTVVGLGMSRLDPFLKAAAGGQERVLNADPEPEKGSYYRSDHFELAKQGVPMLYPKRGYDHDEMGFDYGMQKSAEYTANHYHRVSDEYDLSWDVSGALEDMELYYRTGLEIANSDQWPSWAEGSEFKAIRDAQRPNTEGDPE
jgi:Zn-dependent M28 family amino/carboxypeptidase